jgi:hypothetical protein
MRIWIFICLIFSSFLAYGTRPEIIEDDLYKHLSKINYWADNYVINAKINSEDSLIKENKIFKQKILKYTSNHPSTLLFDFKRLKSIGLTVALSGDKLFKIYSWDTRTGGTMHYYDGIYQYKTDKVYSESYIKNRQDNDFGCWFSEIFTLISKKEKVYIGYFHKIYSTSESAQGVKLFNFKGNSLNQNLKLIKTKTGIKNELSFEFNFFSVAGRKERPVKLIYFDNKLNTLKIPVVNEKSNVTSKSITYVFNGQFFVKKESVK